MITLSQAKNYLRIDDDFTEDDESIQRMIKSAFQFIEKRTNHVFYQEFRTYNRLDRKYIDIFDYPVTYEGELTKLDYSGFTRFDADSVTVTVGYATADDVPSPLIEAALQMLKVFYFEGEKQINTTLIPENVHQILSEYRRFTVV